MKYESPKKNQPKIVSLSESQRLIIAQLRFIVDQENRKMTRSDYLQQNQAIKTETMNKKQHRSREIVTHSNQAKDNTFFEDEKKEKTMIMGMPPDMKEFYLEFKKNNPGREDEYYKEYVSLKRREIQERLTEEENEKSLAKRLAQKASFWQLRTN